MPKLKLPWGITKCFVDLDDVLVDFMGQAAIILGFCSKANPEARIKARNFINTGSGSSILWEQVYKEGPEWWASLPKLPWADELLGILDETFEHVSILTSPGNYKGSEFTAHGKLLWSVNEFSSNRLIITTNKHMCCCSGALLIDDWGKFLLPWEKHGGVAVQLKREWGTSGYTPKEILRAIKNYNKLYKGEIFELTS